MLQANFGLSVPRCFGLSTPCHCFAALWSWSIFSTTYNLAITENSLLNQYLSCRSLDVRSTESRQLLVLKPIHKRNSVIQIKGTYTECLRFKKDSTCSAARSFSDKTSCTHYYVCEFNVYYPFLYLSSFLLLFKRRMFKYTFIYKKKLSFNTCLRYCLT